MTSTQLNNANVAKQRVRAFTQRYGQQATDLAAYAAFPLALTTDLVYCLRETFLPDYPWYLAADLLLSGLCTAVGYDLYEIEPDTRLYLLGYLRDRAGEAQVYEVERFMVAYLRRRLRVENTDRPRILGERPQWTSLACLRPGKAYQEIQQTLQQLTLTEVDPQERIRWAALVESYADLLAEKGFQPLLLEWSEQIFEGQSIQSEAMQLATAMGIFLEFFEFESAKIAPVDESTEELQPFEFEVVTVNAQREISQRQELRAFYFTEPLGELSLEMVAIPGGTFMMGSPDRKKRESPQHRVTVEPFFLAKYPITQAQWRFIAQLPQSKRKLNLAPFQFIGDDRYPVESVSWYDAVEFCNRLSQYTGRLYRLPSEAEWEYACRAQTNTQYHFGKRIVHNVANFRDDPQKQTTPVGSFGVANAFGLYDMHGNVFEWCEDDWHDSYKGAPTDGSPWLDKDNKDTRKIVRGGSFLDSSRNCRSAYRNFSHPDDRVSNIGFRVVCALQEL